MERRSLEENVDKSHFWKHDYAKDGTPLFIIKKERHFFYERITANGEKTPLSFVLKKGDAQWKISKIEILWKNQEGLAKLKTTKEREKKRKGPMHQEGEIIRQKRSFLCPLSNYKIYKIPLRGFNYLEWEWIQNN